MPVTGRPPKPEGQKVTRHPLTQEFADVVNVPYLGDKPSLGTAPAATKRWWEVVSSLPHCANWDAGDWQFAVDTARIHAAFVKGDMARAPELRLRERSMGTTADARRDLRIRYVDPQAEAEASEHADAGVTVFEDERRKRVTGAG